MAFVGLLFVGVVLIVNGLMLLGVVEARSAGPLNLFVGALQVVTPTYLIFLANTGNTDAILAVAGIYLFGFTYLYVGINLLGNLDGTGLGWYSIFVTACALVIGGLNFSHYHSIASFDTGFGVIWLYWAVLWALFWVVLGLKREEWTRYTGGVAIVAGIATAAGPAFLLLTGSWTRYLRWEWPALAILLAISLVALLPLRTRYQAAPPQATPVVPGETPRTPEGVPTARGPATDEARSRAQSG
jgi:putative amide transporter protein